MNRYILTILIFFKDNIYLSTFTLSGYFFSNRNKKVTSYKLENYHEKKKTIMKKIVKKKNSNLEKYMKVRKITVTETSRNNTIIQ